MPQLTTSILTALLLLAQTALAGTPSSGPGAAVAYHRLHREAVQAFQSGDLEGAKKLFRELVEREPSNVEAWYGLFVSADGAGDSSEAIAAGERVHAQGYVDPPRTSYRLARLQARAGRVEEALEWLERSLAERFESRPAIAGDEAFESLRRHPRFRRLAGLLPEGETKRGDGWRFDLDYLVEEAQRMHADPERPAFSPAFLAEASRLRAAVDELSDDQIHLQLMALVARLGDGHSGIYGPDEETPCNLNTRVLPLKFYLFPEGLYIVDGIGEHAALAGLRVVRFGSLTAEEVLERMSRYRGVDNAMTWRWMGPQFYVGRLALLEGVAATASPEVVELTVEDRNGARRTLVVAGGDHRIQRKLRPPPGLAAEPPLYLLAVEQNYWLRPLPEHRALYFQFNQVRDDEEESLVRFSGRLHEMLTAGDFDHLIVDVRHNNGGNNSLLRPLLRTLIAFDFQEPGHRVFVITGRNTFSAAQNFISRLDRWVDADFVGEPSASSPNFVGEETDLLLPYSRIRGSISTRHWQDSSPGDQRPWIAPDFPVVLGIDDYLSGRDPALAAVFEEIARAAGPRP